MLYLGHDFGIESDASLHCTLPFNEKIQTHTYSFAMRRLCCLALVLIAVPLTSCSPLGLAAGAGAGVGVAAAQEGGLNTAVDDAYIKAMINDAWFRYDVETFRKLNLTVNQGRVLVTGVVEDPEDRVEAIRLAWQPKGVHQVINEVRVEDGSGISGYLRDSWITAKLRTKMMLDKEIQSVNYSVDTVDRTVYLMGVAYNKQELNSAIELARTISGVDQVVSYVKMAGEQKDPLGASADKPYRDKATPDSTEQQVDKAGKDSNGQSLND